MAVALASSGSLFVGGAQTGPISYGFNAVGPTITFHIVTNTTSNPSMTATWQGSPMTLLTSQTDGNGVMAFLFGMIGAVITGAFITVNYTGSINIEMNAYSWSGADQSALSTTFYSRTTNFNSAASSPLNVTTSLAIASGDVAIEVGGVNGSSTIGATNQTALPNSPDATVIPWEANYANGAGSPVSFSASLTPSNPWVSCACGILAGGAVTPGSLSSGPAIIQRSRVINY